MQSLVVGALAFVLLAWLWHTHRGQVVGAMRPPNKTHVWLGSPRRVTLTVRRIASSRTVRAALTMRVYASFRGGPLSLADSTRCAELLDRCAAEGRVGEGGTGACAGAFEIAPEYDLEQGRMVAVIPRLGYPEIRALLTPGQARTVAAWLRTATAAQEKRAARAAP